MTATLASTDSLQRRTTLRPGPGSRSHRGVAPLARPELGGPSPSRSTRAGSGRRFATAAACRVSSPVDRREGLLLRVKVGAIALVALLGVGVSAAEVSSWAHPDPAVDFVAGHPAWAHVTGR